MNFEEAVNINNMGLFYEQLIMSTAPFISESYFPSQSVPTNVIKYLTSQVSTPALADASTFDGHMLPTNNDSFQERIMNTQFFRNEYVVNEQDIMNINEALSSGDDNYLTTVVSNLFQNQTKALVAMRGRREWLGMQALVNGLVEINQNGVHFSLNYDNKPEFTTSSSGDWSDPSNKTWYTDIKSALKTMQAYGIFPNQMLMNSNTFDWLRNNEQLKATVPTTNIAIANGQLSQQQVVDYFRSEFRINIVAYDKGYFENKINPGMPNADKQLKEYIPDGKVVMMLAPLPPAPWLLQGSLSPVSPVAGSPSAIGHMNFAPTPESLGLRSGHYNSDQVAIFDTGVAFHIHKDDKYNREEDITAMNVMPSLEGNDQIFRMTVAQSNSNNATINGNSSNNANANASSNNSTPPKA